MEICFGYEIVPPDFLFWLVKPFICLDGIVGFSENSKNTKELFDNGIKTIPKFVLNLLEHGINDGIKNIT